MPGSTDGPIEDIKRRNIEKHLAMIDDAAKQGVQILCMQEVFTTPYFCAEQQVRLVRSGREDS
jgi:N-carbamoylputrescine amidase